MSLDLCSNLVQMLNDGAVDGTSQIGMFICNNSRFVSDSIIDILRSGVKQKISG
jgi:hypothetical protein